MTEVVAAAVPPQNQFHLKRLVIWLASIVVIGLVAYLLGWNIRGWFSELWDTLTQISVKYLIPALVLQTLQTLFTAVAWLAILRYAYPDSGVPARQVIACYATSVALNTFLPANLGTLVMLIMFTAIIVGATFAGIFAGYLVEKIFFTVIGAVVYVYLFVSVGGSFDIKFGWVSAHPWATAIIAVGVVLGVVILCRLAWRWLKKLWAQAKQGGKILADWKAYFGRVFLPEFLGWCCKLGVIALFLAAYGIPVSFHTVMRIVGGNSIANVASVTPGGVGVNQAFNVASLKGVTDSTTATAYSVAQQLVTTAWNIVFAVVLVAWAFGWTGGRKLVGDSYTDAKVKAADQKAQHKAKRQAKKAAKQAEDADGAEPSSARRLLRRVK
ncbi:MAG: lysylphosphatidylglycerol synthase transmembrane domain-containing protein [Gaiellaceae bacterium]